MRWLCFLGLHRWRAPARQDASTFARCTTCRQPALFRRRPAPSIWPLRTGGGMMATLMAASRLRTY